MKDFYDCYKMIQENILCNVLLHDALLMTSANRGTLITKILESVESFLPLWKNFKKMNGILDFDLKDVVRTSNKSLKKS